MSIRTISYTVTESGITPTTVQHGGVQGDHNATELVFTLPSDFAAAISNAAGDAKVYYRFDGYTGSGVMASTYAFILDLEGIPNDGITLTYPLEKWITSDGGNIQVYLVITAIKTTESAKTTELELYSFPALLSLKNRPRGKSYDGNSHESITTLAKRAEGSAESAEAALKELKEGIENGDFKGEKGEDAVTDQTYSPTSPNAQSGKAVAEAVAPKANTTYINNTFANALKGSASGEKAVVVNDVSPIEHDLDVKITSKNLIPYPYTETTKTENGITFTDNGDGTIALSGTIEQLMAGVYFTFGKATLDVGTYICSYGTAANGCVVEITYENGNFFTLISGATTFTVTEKSTFVVKGYVMSGNTPTGYFLPQIELGTVATDYTPNIDDLSTVTISRYWKNLLPYPYAETTKIINGITFTDNGDGTITANGTATGTAYFILNRDIPISEKTICSSGCPAGGSVQSYFILISYGGNSYQDVGDGLVKTPTDVVSVQLRIQSGTTVENLVFKPQIELGSVATPYEPYIEPQTVTANADGTVEGLTSISPSMTLVTDTEGIKINLEYNRDINKAFAELQQAILNSI